MTKNLYDDYYYSFDVVKTNFVYKVTSFYAVIM